MKDGIHPEYNSAKVSCACGNEFEIGSTAKEIKVEICSKCHPFFTGKQKLVDSAGRVERFKRKYAKYSEAGAGEKATSSSLLRPKSGLHSGRRPCQFSGL